MKSDIKEKIIIEIKKNSKIRERDLAKVFFKSERTIRRYIKELKEDNKIKLEKKGKLRNWKIL